MKIRDEKLEIFCNGKCIDTTHLNRGYQSAVFYFENEDAAAELAKGKTKKQANADYLRRAAIAHFNAAMKTAKDLLQIDAAAADSLYDEFTDALQPQDDEDSVYLGMGVYCNRAAFENSLNTLRAEGATLFRKEAGQAVDIDSGEPVKLEEFTPEAINPQ